MTSDECMFIAGDPSGDRHSAPIIRHLHSLLPDLKFTGIGGPAMCQEGFTSLLPFEPFNKMGFIEVVRHLPFFLRAKKYLITYIKKRNPRCLVCVDYSGFNIPMMKAAHRLGVPVIWYIAPMVWAWGKKRAAVLGKYASHICCIFPFEVSYFKPFSENVHFVGNPVVEALEPSRRPAHRSEPFTVVFVPGSRVQEVSRLLPAMVDAYRLLKQRYSDCRGVVSRHPALRESFFSAQTAGTDLSILTTPLSELFRRCDMAVVTSGTATLEAALAGIPHVIVYKTSAVTYALSKHFIVLSHIGLPNIIADETIAPELIQQYVTDRGIVQQLNRFVETPGYYTQTTRKLTALKELLGSQRPSVRVAEIIRSVAG